MKNKLMRWCLLIGLCLIVTGCQSTSDKEETQHSDNTVMSTTKAQPTPQKTKIKSQLTQTEQQDLIQALKNRHFSGTILLIRNGKPVYGKGIGYANKERNIKNQIDSIYQMDSIQKIITATLILKCVQENKLSLDDTLDKFYPHFPNSQWITIQSLLNMTSGLKLDPNKKPKEIFTSQDDYIQYYADNITANTVGTWKYEAVNYSILAGILEKITHQNYDELVQKEIIQPLHLKNIGFVNEYDELDGLSIGYNQKGYSSPYIEQDYQIAREMGTGNMYCSAPTLYKLINSIINGKIISKNLFDQTHQGDYLKTRTYQSGCYVQSKTYLFHGMGFGYDTTAVISKDGKDGVILLSNMATKDYMPHFANLIYEYLIQWHPQTTAHASKKAN